MENSLEKSVFIIVNGDILINDHICIEKIMDEMEDNKRMLADIFFGETEEVSVKVFQLRI